MKKTTRDHRAPQRQRDPQAAREAARYERPIPSREAIMALLEEGGELLKAGAIADALGLSEEVDLLALEKRLGAMVRDGQLLRNRRQGYAVARKLDLIRGTVIANAEGFGFLAPDDGGTDLFLSPHEMRKVLHGDRILASIASVDHRGRRRGTVVRVLERRPPRIVGTVISERGVTTVAPDDRRLHQDVLIPPDHVAGARAGQIVIAEITDPPTDRHGPIGRIERVLGDRLEPSLAVEMAIVQHDLPGAWPDNVARAAGELPTRLSRADLAGRRDLRKLPLVTIDGADSRDFDDAVWAERRGDGGFRLVVAIADVAHYVRPGDVIDAEASERGTSTYFPGFVIPMLPEVLSNGMCSLNPDVDRLCIACDMSVDAEGNVTRARFSEAVMRSHARLTYDETWQATGLRDRETRARLADVVPLLDDLHALYKVLARARRHRGTIDFDSREVRFFLSAEGEVQSMEASERTDAHRLIEECMIAANVQAARFLERRKIPALYRVHAPPPADKYEDLLDFLRQYKLRLPPVSKVTSADYAALLRKVRDEASFEVIQTVLLRSMSMAVYMPENQGHFGLALDAYAHFTAPIRRYPDLVVHRAIRHALRGGKRADYAATDEDMRVLGVHCSQRERRSEEAERDVDERFKCAWMERHVGEEFAGHVSGVASFGLFVELDESTVSGLLHVTQLPNDYYQFEPEARLLRGQHGGLVFRLGDAVRVIVLKASMLERKVDLRLVREEPPAKKRSRGRRQR